MNKKLIYGIIGLALATLLIFVLIKAFSSSVETPSISLPAPSEQANGDPSDSDILNVDTETIQALLKSLDRPESFNLGYEQIVYHADGEATTAVSFIKSGDMFRISSRLGSRDKHTLFADGMINIWYGDSGPVFTEEFANFDFSTAEKYAGLLSYDELLSVPIEDITDAGYELINNNGCIYAEYRTKGEYVDRDYLTRLYIDLDTAALTQAEILENGEKIYSLFLHINDSNPPSEEYFILP